jgi:hypothetical protein
MTARLIAYQRIDAPTAMDPDLDPVLIKELV